MKTPDPPSKHQLLYADLCVELKYYSHWSNYVEGANLPEKFLNAANTLKNIRSKLQEKHKKKPHCPELESSITQFKYKDDFFTQKLVEYIQESVLTNNIPQDVEAIFNKYLQNLNTTAYLGDAYIQYINELDPEKNCHVFCTLAAKSTEEKLESFKKQLLEFYSNEPEIPPRKFAFIEFTNGYHYEVSSLLKDKNTLEKLNKLLKAHNHKLKLVNEANPVPTIERNCQSVIHAIEWCEQNLETKPLVKYMTRLKNKLSQNIQFRPSGVTTHSIPASSPDYLPRRNNLV
ncbi:MAG: hypothetical protein V4591_06955 [Bdellovibrionota bacterium]